MRPHGSVKNEQDFISRCNPLPGSTDAAFFGLTNLTICQTPSSDPIIRDGMRSFFSGHAILSAAGYGFVSLYWAGKMHLFNKEAHTVMMLLAKPWVCPHFLSVQSVVSVSTHRRIHLDMLDTCR